MTDSRRKKCQCKDCGKFFLRGEEGDNEEFCLRCERIALNRLTDDGIEEPFELGEPAHPASDDIWDEGY